MTAPSTATSRLYRLKPPTPSPPIRLIAKPPTSPPMIPTIILPSNPCSASVFITSDAIQPAMPPNIIHPMIPVGFPPYDYL